LADHQNVGKFVTVTHVDPRAGGQILKFLKIRGGDGRHSDNRHHPTLFTVRNITSNITKYNCNCFLLFENATANIIILSANSVHGS